MSEGPATRRMPQRVGTLETVDPATIPPPSAQESCSPVLAVEHLSSHPAIHISWQDAKAYTAWLSRKTGAQYRLLTDNEWEVAARAGTTTAFYWGPQVGKN